MNLLHLHVAMENITKLKERIKQLELVQETAGELSAEEILEKDRAVSSLTEYAGMNLETIIHAWKK